MYLSRQLYEEALHVQFYLTLLDTYIPDLAEREKAFQAIHNIPSIARKAEFCFKWMDSVNELERGRARKRGQEAFLLNLICFATASRASSSSPPSPTSTSCAARASERPGVGHQLGLPRRVLPHGLRPRGGQHGARGSTPRMLRRAHGGPGRHDARGGRRLRDAASPRTFWAAGSPGCRPRDMRTVPRVRRGPAPGQPRPQRRATTPRTPSRSWTFKTCRSSRTSSSGASPPTRSP